MTSYYTSASHFRHPWFDSTISKRKQPVPVNLNEDMDDGDDSELRPIKRRRCTGLENGIAHLSLNTFRDPSTDYMHQASSAGPIIEEVPDISPTGTSTSSEAGSTSPGSDREHIILPGSVEEPPSVPEVRMGASSWYEPERDRIIITDLDEYAAEDDGADDGGLTVEEMDAPSRVKVNPVFLEQLRSGRIPLDRLHQAPCITNEAQALVLFRPLPFAQAPPRPGSELEPGSLQETPGGSIEEDAMDLDV